MLNETYELLLRYFSLYSSTIGFPELAYPSLVRVSSAVYATHPLPTCTITQTVTAWYWGSLFVLQLRKVCKSVSFSWLRLQLKQLIEKVTWQFIFCDCPVGFEWWLLFFQKFNIYFTSLLHYTHASTLYALHNLFWCTSGGSCGCRGHQTESGRGVLTKRPEACGKRTIMQCYESLELYTYTSSCVSPCIGV